MSVKREDNICTITFEDENWKEEAPEVFTVTDGAVPFYTADTWKYNKKYIPKWRDRKQCDFRDNDQGHV